MHKWKFERRITMTSALFAGAMQAGPIGFKLRRNEGMNECECKGKVT